MFCLQAPFMKRKSLIVAAWDCFALLVTAKIQFLDNEVEACFGFISAKIYCVFPQDERKRLKNAIIIQSYIRGYQDLKQQVSL